MQKTVGIIAEYNPFHTGHAYQIEYLKKQGYDNVVIVQSGSCVQRGSIGIVSKFKRATMAIENGADLVVELPFPYSSMSAEKFAYNAVYLLQNIGVDAICFGSESADKFVLNNIASYLLTNEYNDRLSNYLKLNTPFAIAREKALIDHFDFDSNFIKASNDILAIEYIKACMQLNFSPEVIPLKRIGANYNDTSPKQGFASASFIRNCIANFNWDTAYNFIPKNSLNTLSNILDRGEYFTLDKDFERCVLFTLKSKTPDYFFKLPDCNQELSHAFVNALQAATNFEQLFNYLPTKHYTNSRLSRIILFAMLEAFEDDIPKTVPYIRFLAVNKDKEHLLKYTFTNSKIPVSHSSKKLSLINDNCLKVSLLENNATALFSLFCKISQPTDSDYTTKFLKI